MASDLASVDLGLGFVGGLFQVSLQSWAAPGPVSVEARCVTGRTSEGSQRTERAGRAESGFR